MDRFIVTYNSHMAIANNRGFNNCKFSDLFSAVCYAVRYMDIYSPIREPINEQESGQIFEEMFKHGYSLTNNEDNIIKIEGIH